MSILAIMSILACSAPEEADPYVPWADGEEVSFAGISELTYDGEDGVIARWNGASAASIYTVRAELSDGTVRVQTTDRLSLHLRDLPEGLVGVSVSVDEEGSRAQLWQRVSEERLVLRSRTPLSGIADVWGEGDIVVVAGLDSGASFHVFDISDPEAPELLSRVVGKGWTKDVKLRDGVLFTQGECDCAGSEDAVRDYDRVGVRSFDLTNPREPVLLSEVRAISSSHNLTVSPSGLLGATERLNSALVVMDVADPEGIVPVWTYTAPRAFVHDATFVDELLYIAWWGGIAVVDLADASDPVVLVEQDLPLIGAVHNIWPSEDGTHVFVTSEQVGGHLTALKLIDGDAVQVGAFEMGEEEIIHNVMVKGDYAYVAYYRQGLVIVDASDPTNLVLDSQFNTFEYAHDDPEHEHSGRPFNGAWGVWALGEHVVVTDREHGLFVFTHYPRTVRQP